MRARAIILTAVVLLIAGLGSRGQERPDWRPTKLPGSRFMTVDVLVDPRGEALAAYQLRVEARRGDVRIVGVEGGDPAAFHEPPYYDPKAIQQDRVILAAFQAAPEIQLPTAKTRVATLHLLVKGSTAPEFDVKLQTAATGEGRRISATASLSNRSNP